MNSKKIEARHDIENKRLELEHYKLELINAGKISRGVRRFSGEGSDQDLLDFDVVTNLKLVPKFDESEIDSFFPLFERVAGIRGWSDSERVLLLQCVFTGRAQEVFSSLSTQDAETYEFVKSAVLKAFELVPEAYRQRFRGWQKSERQTHVEFVREVQTHFNRWCSASNVETLNDLKELVLLELFKNSVPPRIATYVTETKACTAYDAAVLADEYALIHKNQFGQKAFREIRREPGWVVHDKSRESPDMFRGRPLQSPGGFELVDVCNYCQAKGHWKKECPVLKAKAQYSLGSRKPQNVVLGAKSVGLVTSIHPSFETAIEGDCETLNCSFSPFITDGWVSLIDSKEKNQVKILRDTGATESFISENVLSFSSESYTGSNVLIRGLGLNVVSVPLHKVMMVSDLVQGEVTLGVRPCLPVVGVDIILGNNLAGGRVWSAGSPALIVSPSLLISEGSEDENAQSFPEVFVSSVVTRAGSKSLSGTQSDVKREGKTLTKIPSVLTISRSDLVSEQQADVSLVDLFDRLLSPDVMQDTASGYYLDGEMLVRKWVPHGEDFVGDPIVQIVVPKNLRELVLKTAHDTSGHLGVKKTYQLILKSFFWPKLKRDVSAYIKTCPTCQLTGKPNQILRPAPLFPIPVVNQPFEHLIVDCVGPLPKSKAGSKYLLTIMCQTTRFPAAYSLRSITTKTVLKALTQFIALFGIPKVIQTDQGSNFTSKMFAQILKQLHVKHQKASAYHAQSQGALERFHQTLKSLLRSYCTHMKGDWEDGLPWLLMSAREASQESTGFSPNELVFGHSVRSPMSLLSEDLKNVTPPKNLLNYVSDFRRRLYESCAQAKANLGHSQDKMKRLFDRRAEVRIFKSGDQVLALVPVVGSPFQAKFVGPYTVLRQISDLNYLIETPDRRKKTRVCHVNLLKPYYVPDAVKDSTQEDVTFTLNSEIPEGFQVKPVLVVGARVETSLRAVQAVPVSDDEGLDPGEFVTQGCLENTEALKNLGVMLKHLPDVQSSDVIALINEYVSLFPDTPTQTNLIKHDIDVGDAKPVLQHYYRVPLEKKRHLEAEVEYLLKNGLAEPSYSSWASPCILVRKANGSFRFCTDYRKVNALTKPDSFPLPRIEDCIDQVGSAVHVSKFDLLKGYWQVPLTARAQEISAFVTPSGLFSYKVMSFGLRNAPATFQRLMNRVISGLEGCAVYLDDVVIYSDTWLEHLSRIRALFDRLAAANLTVNLR